MSHGVHTYRVTRSIVHYFKSFGNHENGRLILIRILAVAQFIVTAVSGDNLLQAAAVREVDVTHIVLN
jgi:hypothetical protein